MFLVTFLHLEESRGGTQPNGGVNLPPLSWGNKESSVLRMENLKKLSVLEAQAYILNQRVVT